MGTNELAGGTDTTTTPPVANSGKRGPRTVKAKDVVAGLVPATISGSLVLGIMARSAKPGFQYKSLTTAGMLTAKIPSVCMSLAKEALVETARSLGVKPSLKRIDGDKAGTSTGPLDGDDAAELVEVTY